MNQEQSRALGSLLRQKRLELGVTTHQLGLAAGVDHSTVSRIETGLFAAPRPDRLARFAELLGFDLADLFARAGYLDAQELPNFEAYLFAKYAELPKVAVTQLVELFTNLAERYGLSVERKPEPAIERPVAASPTAEELANDPSFLPALHTASGDLSDDLEGAAA